MMNNDVCAIIVTYNAENSIKETIYSIYKQVKEVIIIDNNSLDNTNSIIELCNLQNIKLIKLNKNMGIARALNIGIKYSMTKEYKYVITLDHDSILEEASLKILLESFKLNNIGIVGPDIINLYENKSKYNNLIFDNNKYYVKTSILQSGSVYSLDVFKKIGFFNEDLFVYCVDDEFCRRALKEFNVIINKNAKLYHKEGEDGEKKILCKKLKYRKYSNTALYYICRNCVYMGKVYDLKYFLRIILEVKNIILYSKNRVENLKFVLKGIYHGVKGKYGCIEKTKV
ncbi:glycosyltransferase [Clostridium perfringens]